MVKMKFLDTVLNKLSNVQCAMSKNKKTKRLEKKKFSNLHTTFFCFLVTAEAEQGEAARGLFRGFL